MRGLFAVVVIGPFLLALARRVIGLDPPGFFEWVACCAIATAVVAMRARLTEPRP